MTSTRGRPANALVRDGLVGHVDQLASAHQSLAGLDTGQLQRAIDLQVVGGISARLLPDRGMDVSAAWFDGIPLAWVSRRGDVRAATPGTGSWIGQFGGGLVTTCGLQNVGVASEGHGQHGSFSATPASAVSVERATTPDDEIELVVTGVVEEGDALDVHLRCERRLTTRTGKGLLTVTDRVTNVGTAAVPAPMLYHVNLGAPLWSPGGYVTAPAGSRTVARDADSQQWVGVWEHAPRPSRDGVERVFEHVLDGTGDREGPDTWAQVQVTHEELGLRLTVAWDVRAMPRLHQWVHPRAGVYVLGIEPANCSVLGRAADRAAGRLPVLQPGESRTTSLRVGVSRLT
ncbi:aldose 1-epimerase family protein [Lapillicoccus sp.]|uniref:aldose 1-epimerase family protein n=1 Tax=Lapillicoccus sp. TaxID=1909287 RepID=UPI003264A43F